MPDSKPITYYVEVETAYEPTEMDDFGCDGMYIKSVRTLSKDEVALLRISKARGAVPWHEGEELPEDAIRRMRDA